MELILFRKWYTNKSTIGELFLHTKRECYILEDRSRPGEAKVYGETCIPPDRYELYIGFSPHFGMDMIRFKSVRNYVGVLMHWGNKPEDTLGCLLTGTTKSVDWVGGSKDAYNALYAKVEAAINRGERVFITIVDNPDDDYFKNAVAVEPGE